MINSLSIQNVQSHKNTKLEFDPGLNIIVGTTDSGKSAILRSLRWLVWNRPSGDSLRSWWGGRTEVVAVLSNGVIERSKDKREEYIVNNGTPLRAFGLSVPEEVSDVLNLSEINLQAQMDSPFLLSNTPGEVALHFNKVAGLDKIDRAQQNVEREIRSLTSDIKYKTAEQEKLKEQLEDFKYLEKYEIKLEVLEELEEKKLKNIKNVSKLGKQISILEEVIQDIEKASAVLQYEKQVNQILVSIETKKLAIAERKKLKGLYSDYLDLTVQIESQETIISIEPLYLSVSQKIIDRKELVKNHRNLSLLKNEITALQEEQEEQSVLLSCESNVTAILLLCEDKKTKTSSQNKLKFAVNTLKHAQTCIIDAEAEFTRLSALFKKEMPIVCPLCGSSLKKVT